MGILLKITNVMHACKLFRLLLCTNSSTLPSRYGSKHEALCTARLGVPELLLGNRNKPNNG